MKPLSIFLSYAALLAPSGFPSAAGGERDAVDFTRDIRPVLSDACFKCHGPDEAKRKAKLRLDTRQGALELRDGKAAVVPGSLEMSELVRRISSTDPDERMPPSGEVRRLSSDEIARLRRWVADGAPWEEHWAFVPPRRPPLPAVSHPERARSEIDTFILSRLEEEGFELSGEASPQTLLRRVSLDLTGLPPTPGDIDRLLADAAPGAYERAVDRLLGSPRFGERLASHWLDAARYADTNGYQTDGERSMWRWRDWVIDAWNAGQPFDEFTIEQLAGDLLSDPSLEQIIATGFNRNHRGNGEGGIVDQEYLVEYVVDRVDTTATVWLGLTLGCARCHDHKYDPIPQKDFYRVFAYFNKMPERGRAFKFGNSAPLVRAPTREQAEAHRVLAAELARATETLERRLPELRSSQRRWETRFATSPQSSTAWDLDEKLLLHLALDGEARDLRVPWRATPYRGLEPRYVTGRVGSSLELTGREHLEVAGVKEFGYLDRFTLAAWVHASGDAEDGDSAPTGPIVTRIEDPEVAPGYELRLEKGRVQVNLVKRWLDDALRVETERRLKAARWYHIAMTYDGSRLANGIRITIDGESAPTRVLLDELNQSFETPEPVRIGATGLDGDRFRGRIDDVRIYDRRLEADELRILGTAETIPEIAAIPPAKRREGQRLKIDRYYVETSAPATLREQYALVKGLEKRLETLMDGFPTTMVMRDMPTPRPTHVLLRGRYDRPGERVEPGTLSSLPPPTALDAHRDDRLGFARWLVQSSNPLTARVTVNRFWQMLFGTGIVETVEDFGSQGARPSHPELLDWLATEFVRGGWDVKTLLRTIVTSATYRQTSTVETRWREKDPANRLLARAPRLRLSAEMVRDQALAASGLLVERLGGPSVKPYQPPGLWKELSGAAYERDSGADLYRRSLYTFRKRTCGPPAMMAFDASSREACTVRQTRTNTPLQALTLMNDVTYVETARALAERVLAEVGEATEENTKDVGEATDENTEEGLTLAFRLTTGRRPTTRELAILKSALAHHRTEFSRNPEGAERLVSVGVSVRRRSIDTVELAAWTAVANLILNLDEVITRG